MIRSYVVRKLIVYRLGMTCGGQRGEENGTGNCVEPKSITTSRNQCWFNTHDEDVSHREVGKG